jgi:hypothetical protein
MRSIFLLGLMMFSFLAQAQPESDRIKSLLESQPSCGNFIRSDEQNIYLGYGWYKNGIEEPRLPIPARITVVPQNGSENFDLQTNDAAIDLVTVGTSAFVLTYSSIEEWDLTSRQRIGEYQTYAFSGPMKYKQHAQAMARFGDKLYIAHGRLGISIFNVKTKRLVKQFRILDSQLPLESMATGITIQGNFAYIVVDNFTLVPSNQKPPFRGMIVMDLRSDSIVKQLDGMDPGVTSIASDSKSLIVSFGGNPIWKYDLKDISGVMMPEPVIRIWKFPMDGHPVGSGFMDDKYYYSCYAFPPPAGQGGFYKKRPFSLNRLQLMID